MLKRTGWGKTTTQTSIAYAHITTISHKSRTERSRTQSTMAAATAQPDTPGKIDPESRTMMASSMVWGNSTCPAVMLMPCSLTRADYAVSLFVDPVECLPAR